MKFRRRLATFDSPSSSIISVILFQHRQTKALLSIYLQVKHLSEILLDTQQFSVSPWTSHRLLVTDTFRSLDGGSCDYQ